MVGFLNARKKLYAAIARQLDTCEPGGCGTFGCALEGRSEERVSLLRDYNRPQVCPASPQMFQPLGHGSVRWCGTAPRLRVHEGTAISLQAAGHQARGARARRHAAGASMQRQRRARGSPAHLLVRLRVRPHACSRRGDVTKREGSGTLVRARLATRRAARAQRGAQQAWRARRVRPARA